MQLLGKVLLGFFVGFLCGLVPLVYGLITKDKIMSVVGLTATAVTGIFFSLIDKSPFTAMIMAVIFAIIIFAKNKHNSEESEEDE